MTEIFKVGDHVEIEPPSGTARPDYFAGIWKIQKIDKRIAWLAQEGRITPMTVAIGWLRVPALALAGHGKDPSRVQLAPVVTEVIDAELVDDDDDASALTQTEQEILQSLEVRIELGIEAYWQAGLALKEISDLKLYRASYSSFEDYLENRWRMSRRRGYQLVEAAGVIEQLQNEKLCTTGTQFPENERQARELARLPESVRLQVWASVLSDGKPTASKIREAYKGLDNPDRHDVHLTPPPIKKLIAAILGEVDLDPCSDKPTNSNPNIPARYHYTKDGDGLSFRNPWFGKMFLNPPYSGKETTLEDWANRLVSEWVKNKDLEETLWFVPAYTDTVWWERLNSCAQLSCFLKGRQTYADASGNPQPHAARFPSALIYCARTDKAEIFYEACKDAGIVTQTLTDELFY